MVDPMPRTELRDGGEGRAVHDVGGLAFGAINRSEHDLALWEKRVDAMLILLVGPKKGAFRIDAMRRVIEDYGEQQYDATTYYEKWVRAIRNLLIEQQIITEAELERALAAARSAFAEEGRAIGDGEVPDDGAGRRA
ncbi:MAG: nitrile hydratase subunit beta [Hyphomicrobiaceae bacterium]